MIISVLGRVEHRVIIYTLLKLLQPFGDIGLITDNSYYRRLLDTSQFNTDFEGDIETTHIIITNASPEDVFPSIGMSCFDFEHIIYDNVLPASEIAPDVYIMCKGETLTQDEEDALSQLETCKVITLGKSGKDCIPYSLKTLQAMEHLESTRILTNIDAKATEVLSPLLAPFLGVSSSTVKKVSTL